MTPPASSAASLNEDYVADVEYKPAVDFRNFGYGSAGYNAGDFGELEDDDVQVTEEPDRGHWKVFITHFSLDSHRPFWPPLQSCSLPRSHGAWIENEGSRLSKVVGAVRGVICCFDTTVPSNGGMNLVMSLCFFLRY